jgi:hypothetical protein
LKSIPYKRQFPKHWIIGSLHLRADPAKAAGGNTEFVIAFPAW